MGKSFGKIQHLFMIEPFNRVSVEETLLNLIKAIYDRLKKKKSRLFCTSKYSWESFTLFLSVIFFFKNYWVVIYYLNVQMYIICFTLLMDICWFFSSSFDVGRIRLTWIFLYKPFYGHVWHSFRYVGHSIDVCLT